MQKKMIEKKKIVAYVLTQDPDFNNTQREVADLLHVSQSTVSAAIKEIRLKVEIGKLTRQLEEVKREAFSIFMARPSGSMTTSLAHSWRTEAQTEACRSATARTSRSSRRT